MRNWLLNDWLKPHTTSPREISDIARKGFDKDDYTYDEVFGDLPSTLTIKESSEYLGVSEVTVRRWAKEGKLPFHKVGKNYVFGVDDLRKLKRGQSSRP